MRTTIIIFLISILMEFSYAQNSPQKPDGQILKNVFNKDSSWVLDFYRQYSSFTDPGEYAYLYKNLPDSLPELCSLIKSQFIHPIVELPDHRDQIPEERWNKSVKYTTVKSILKGLVSYDSRGLVTDRKPEDRLVLHCWHCSILLASILKYRGIPARVRYGYAPYLTPGFHSGHVICEVWNENDKRWMLVDPSTNMIDYSRKEFDFSNDSWLKMQKKEIDPNLYGMPGNYSKYNGLVSIASTVCLDLASLLGNEYTIYQYAQILNYAFQNNNQLPTDQIEILDRNSELMKSLNAENLSKLQKIYDNTPQIQITKTYLFDLSKLAISLNKPDIKKLSSINKPEIEFADIPGGTFIMGSPVTEPGRQDDEIQHEVTLSAFKMTNTR